MFTNNKATYYARDKVLIESACLSKDSKPTTGIANGSTCLEMDTGKRYAFNEEDGQWEELPSSGGGGGSSDFSTAEVIVTNNSSTSYYTEAPVVNEDVLAMSCDINGNASTTVHYVLYKGSTEASLYDMEGVNPDISSVSVSGDVAIQSGDDYWVLEITGNGTITIS